MLEHTRNIITSQACGTLDCDWLVLRDVSWLVKGVFLMFLSGFCLMASPCVVGRIVKEYSSIGAWQNSSSTSIDVRKFFQGCGHLVHNNNFYYNIAGTYNIAK